MKEISADTVSIDSLLAYYYKYIANISESARDLLIDSDTGKLNIITSYNRMYALHMQNIKTINERLSSGWTPIDILGRLQTAKASGIKTSNIGELIPSRRPPANKPDEELIHPEDRFRHPELRKIEPPIVHNNKLLKPEKLLRRKSFTLGNLTEYYKKQLKPAVDDATIRSVLRNMLASNVNLDDVLSGIDIWAADTTSYSPDYVYNLRRYINKAKEIREFLDTQEATNARESATSA